MRTRSCDEKRRFLTLSDAMAVADYRNAQRALVFSPVAVYWCTGHDTYHVGHLKTRDPNLAKVLESSRQRAEARSEIAAMDAALHCMDHLSFSQALHGVGWIHIEIEEGN